MTLKLRITGAIIVLMALLISCNTSENEITPRIILVSMDGYRWQEMFTGLDSALWKSEYTASPEEIASYWHSDPDRRAELLNPFFMGTLKHQGILMGNRDAMSFVDCTNQLWFSYPGYNEILTGHADDEVITSNDKVMNPNITFLEALNNDQEYSGKVAAFGSWDVFPFIINNERSEIYVNAGFDTASFSNPTETEILLNQLQPFVPSPWSTVRLDVFTHTYAMEYLRTRQPLVTYIAYGETDDYAHDGEYQKYIESAYKTNQFLSELWDWVQTTPGYKDNTYMLITTDHGRGTGDLWKGHGKSVEGAGAIWIGIMGPGIKGGESLRGRFTQSQIAPTIMKLLGKEWERGKPISEIIDQDLNR